MENGTVAEGFKEIFDCLFWFAKSIILRIDHLEFSLWEYFMYIILIGFGAWLLRELIW